MSAPLKGARRRGRVEAHWGDDAGELGAVFPTIVSLDLEATGLSASADHVIEIGAVKFRGGEVVERFHTLVNPGVRISPVVRRLTGIGQDELSGAPGLRDIAPALRTFIDGCDLLAHGAGYDIKFLHEVFGEPVEPRHVFDTLELARVLFPSAPSYSLGGLCDLVGLNHPRPHHAIEDAEASFRLFLEQVRVARRLPPALLAELRELTSGAGDAFELFFHQLVVADVGTGDGSGPSAAPARNEASAQVPTDLGPAPPARTADELAALLGPSGPLAVEPGWELREDQQEMCRAVAQAFDRGVNLVLEAGTGIGKSLAYLLPALAFAAHKRERVCVSTYTIQLQEQLLHKDLPLAARILGIPLRAVLLKGRSHYLSRLRWEQLLAGTRTGATLPIEDERGKTAADARELLIFKLKLTIWLSRTRTGDRDELRLFGQEERLWRNVASEWGGDCRSSSCLDGPSPCFYHLSRQRATAAEVVVVNHSLLLADAFLDSPQLPLGDRLVIDEAHHLDEAATKGLTVEVREDDVVAALAIAASAAPGHRPTPALHRVEGEAAGIFQTVREHCRRVFGSESGRELVVEPGAAPDRDLRARAAVIQSALGGLSETETAVAGEPLRRLVEVLAPLEGHLRWAATNRFGRVALRSTPVEVGSRLREAVFDGRETVVLTSATLAVGGNFDYFADRVGLPRSNLEEMILPSPFDFLNQALLCLPEDVGEPASEGFEADLVDAVEQIALALGGRTLVLFTASEQLGSVARQLDLRLGAEGIEVLAQGRGPGSRRSLVEAFIARPGSVLCGTNSFWEGVDLPGSALSCVVIVRLPFRSPGDPVQRARSAGLRDAFLELTLPEAVLRLRQGFGRLIRKATDRGAVVILDGRVSSRDYGQHFLDALPQCSRYVGPKESLAQAISEWVGDRRGLSFINEAEASEGASPDSGADTAGANPGRRRRQPGAAP